MKKTWLFVLLLSFTAIVIAGTAAYFSVFGLSKLFAGAGISALILFGALEFGKLVYVSVIYRFWKIFSNIIKFISICMIVGIMSLTSLGIYGFLKNAYDATSNKYTTIQKETKIADQRKSTFQLEIDRYQKEIDSKNNQINTYIGNRTTQENVVSNLYNKSTDTTLTNNQSSVFRNRARETQNNIKEVDTQINDLREQNTQLYAKINSLNDSISKYDREILELESSDISVEIGPLKYLADLSGKPMDDVVGFLISLIIFVFDPFAILLIIVANRLSMVKIGELDDNRIIVVEDPKKKKKIDILNSFKKVFKKKEKIENLEPEVVTDELESEIISEKQEETEDIVSQEDTTESEKKTLDNSVDTSIFEEKEITELISNTSDYDDIKTELDNIKYQIGNLKKDYTDDKIKNLINDYTENLKDDFKEYIENMGERLQNIDNKDNVEDIIRDMKAEFDYKLRVINEKLEKKNVIEQPTQTSVTIPGRYSHRSAARRPESTK